MHKKILLAIIALAIIFAFRFYYSNQKTWSQSSWQSLYTQVNLTVEADDKQREGLVPTLDSTFKTLTQEFQSASTLDSLIFQAKVGDTLQLSKHAYALFAFAKDKYTQSNKAIHPGIGNLISLWGLEWGKTPALPSKKALKKELKGLNQFFYELLPQQQSIHILQEKVHFALGAFSKGYAIDVAGQILKKHEIENFLLEVGGDLLWKGKNKTGQDWRIGIRNPDLKNQLLASLSSPNLNFNSMATSGGYEKFFIDSNGTKHHHILDAKTGYSVQGKKSITILSTGAANTDFLATWFFILPTDSVQKILNENPAIEGIIIPDSGNIFISNGLQQHWQLL